MGIRCKFDGGKVFNRIQRGSFEYRSYGAGLRFQLGPDWTSQAWDQVTGEKPGEITNTYYKGRTKKHEADMKRKSTTEYKERRKKPGIGKFFHCGGHCQGLVCIGDASSPSQVYFFAL